MKKCTDKLKPGDMVEVRFSKGYLSESSSHYSEYSVYYLTFLKRTDRNPSLFLAGHSLWFPYAMNYSLDKEFEYKLGFNSEQIFSIRKK